MRPWVEKRDNRGRVRDRAILLHVGADLRLLVKKEDGSMEIWSAAPANGIRTYLIEGES